jgi:hypothetical protein
MAVSSKRLASLLPLMLLQQLQRLSRIESSMDLPTIPHLVPTGADHADRVLAALVLSEKQHHTWTIAVPYLIA